LQAVLNRCLPKARPDCIEKPDRPVSTLVAVELGVANGSNAGDGGRSDEPHQMALSAIMESFP
jgi:hypothetical protein